MYYGYRYYNPSVGRWLSRDPIGEWGGINLYQFAINNPISWIDPLGLSSRCCPNGEPLDCDQLLLDIKQLYDLFRDLSDALGDALNSQYDTLADLYWIDRASDTIFTLGGAALGSAINAARVGLTVMQGTRLGVDLARSGALTGPGLAASADYATAAGGAVGGFVARQAGSQTGSAMRRGSRRGTRGVRQTIQDAIDSLNDAVDTVNDNFSDQRDLYRECCQ